MFWRQRDSFEKVNWDSFVKVNWDSFEKVNWDSFENYKANLIIEIVMVEKNKEQENYDDSYEANFDALSS